MQSEQHVIIRLMAGGEGGGGGGGKIAVSGSSRKEHLDMRCEICYVCS